MTRLQTEQLSHGSQAAVVGFPLGLLRELRTDHAGETGAVMIYHGVLAMSRDPGLRNFARHHLETEQRHLLLMEQVVPTNWRSWLLPLWRLAGWLTGALPACFGPAAVYATIQIVETFVDHHYEQQVVMIDSLLAQSPPADATTNLLRLRTLLVECQLEEVAHKEDARAHWSGQPNVLLSVWLRLVDRGSKSAVGMCRYV
ncbi:MAG: demethoxyubiquinone hydroxylase family protein [Burkholderiaceae bacterium]